MTGGFSRAINIIENAKGWSTSYILDLPLCRFRQVLELIAQEKRDQTKLHAAVVEWQTKHIASMFAVAAREDKQVKAIMKAVKEMNLPLNDEEADNKDTRPFAEVVEQGAIIDYESQPSFERLSAALDDVSKAQ